MSENDFQWYFEDLMSKNVFQCYFEDLMSVSVKTNGMVLFVLPVDFNGNPVKKHLDVLLNALAYKFQIVETSQIVILEKIITKKCKKAYIHRVYDKKVC